MWDNYPIVLSGDYGKLVNYCRIIMIWNNKLNSRNDLINGHFVNIYQDLKLNLYKIITLSLIKDDVPNAKSCKHVMPKSKKVFN